MRYAAQINVNTGIRMGLEMVWLVYLNCVRFLGNIFYNKGFYFRDLVLEMQWPLAQSSSPKTQVTT